MLGTRPRRILALSALTLAAAFAPVVAAQGSARDRAASAFVEAERAEASLELARARARYGDVLAIDPSAPEAQRARARGDYLSARAEGDFAPLAALLRLEGRVDQERDPAAVERLASEAATFPRGRVRSEARLLCAGLWMDTHHQPGRALGLLEQILDDDAAEDATRALAMSELVRAHRLLGDLPGAMRAVDRWPGVAAPALRDAVHREARRVWFHGAALIVLAALGLVGVASAARIAARAGWRAVIGAAPPLHMLTIGLYVGALGSLLVSAHGEATPRPFAMLGAGIVVLVAIARFWSWGRARRWWRPLACVVGVLAVAFLALEVSDARFLDRIGL